MPIISENFKMRPKHNLYSRLIRKYYKIRVNLTKPNRPIPDTDILEKAEKEKRLVIQIPFGGLGDHLAYSSLPELLWRQKGIITFISNKSIFRSRAIRDFVWGLNPYIKFVSDNGWFIHQPLERKFSTLDEYVQNLFDLRGDGRPKVYYKPRIIKQIEGKNVVDPSFGPAGKANGYYGKNFHAKFIGYIRGNISDFVLIIHKHEHIRNELQRHVRKTFDPAVYSLSTIEELADVLFSARKRYLLYSGAASLSAALGTPSAVLCNKKAASNFQYKINEYIDLIESNCNRQMEKI